MTIDATQENRITYIFSQEIVSYSQIIEESHKKLLQLSNSNENRSIEIHNEIRIILTESAMVSLIFFPADKKQTARIRSEILKRRFDVSNGSILKARSLRNHLAHLDERLDNWAIKSRSKTFARATLGSRETIRSIGINEEDILGTFDTETFIYSFLRDDLDVGMLTREIDRVASIARTQLKNCNWA